jgi:autophagy-related protein 13
MSSSITPRPSQHDGQPSRPSSDSTRERTVSSNSSQGLPEYQRSRADQIIHRFFLKTVAVLVEARLTHAQSLLGKGKEGKKDKWVGRYMSLLTTVQSQSP